MKHSQKFRLLTTISLVLLTFSCQHEDDLTSQQEIIDEKKEVDTSKLIDFKGLPVSHRFSTPVEELEVEHDYSQLKELYNKKRKSSALKKGFAFKGEEELPENLLLIAEAEEQVEKYPYGDDKTEEEKWEMIRNDFPTLTEEQIADNMDLIDEYYSQNLDYETIAGLADKTSAEQKLQKSKFEIAYKSNSDLGRVWCIITEFQNPWNLIVPVITGPLPIRTGEFSYIRALISIYYASKRAEEYSTSEYPSLSKTDTKRDAFRHVLWSSLLARYYWTVSSKSTRLRFAEAVGNANEDCGSNSDDGIHMDYRNNRIGRELFNQNTSYLKKRVWFVTITYGLNLPSTSRLRDLTRSKVIGGRFINPATYTTPESRVYQINHRTSDNQVVWIEN